MKIPDPVELSLAYTLVYVCGQLIRNTNCLWATSHIIKTDVTIKKFNKVIFTTVGSIPRELISGGSHVMKHMSEKLIINYKDVCKVSNISRKG